MGYTRLHLDIESANDLMNAFGLDGQLVILGGKSPRGIQGGHAVVGKWSRTSGWQVVHDPHPSGDGILGEPTTVSFWIPKDPMRVLFKQ